MKRETRRGECRNKQMLRLEAIERRCGEEEGGGGGRERGNKRDEKTRK